MDLVLNHTSVEHPWFQESRHSRTNPKAGWYVWSDTPGRADVPCGPIPTFGTSAWTWDPMLSCGATGGGSSVPINGGTVTVTSVSPGSQIAGSVNATLAGGGSLTGSFTANLCAAGAPAVDVCSDIQHLSLNLPPPTCS